MINQSSKRSLSMYAMSCFKISKLICEVIEKGVCENSSGDPMSRRGKCTGKLREFLCQRNVLVVLAFENWKYLIGLC